MDLHSHFVPASIIQRYLVAGQTRSIAYVKGVLAQTLHPLLGDIGAWSRDMDVAGIDVAVTERSSSIAAIKW